ncbi:MAG: hypothetical protein AAF533_21640 [Acidobacteriota bacterium]
MPKALRSLAGLLAVLVGLGLLALTALSVPGQPILSALLLLAEAVHLGCAFLAGTALLALARCRPRRFLETLGFGLPIGLGLLALGTWIGAGLGFVHESLPWLVDVALLLLGAPQIRHLVSVARDEWARLDLAFVMAHRIPLLAAKAGLLVIALSLPFLPLSAETGGAQHVLSQQTIARVSLTDALAASPSTPLLPIDGLLLHGHLAAGEVGARLHGLTLVLLLVLGLHAHVSNRLDGASASWATLALAATPATAHLASADPAGAFVLLLTWNCLRAVLDWCAEATPGRIAIASLTGGVLLSSGATGVTAFALVVALLVLQESFIERRAPWRWAGGVVGLLLVAAVIAAVFVGVRWWLTGALPTLGGLTSLPVDPSPWTWPVPMGLHEGRSWFTGTAIAIGPVLLVGALLSPLVEDWPASLRNTLNALLLALLAWCLPLPWGTGLLLLLPLSVLAGAALRVLLSGSGWGRTVARAVVVLGLPTCLLLATTSGPDLLAGTSLAFGTRSTEAELALRVPDQAVLDVVTDRGLTAPSEILLIGELSDWRYRLPVRRFDDGESWLDGNAVRETLSARGIDHVAADLLTVPEASRLDDLLYPLLRTERLALWTVEAPVEDPPEE